MSFTEDDYEFDESYERDEDPSQDELDEDVFESDETEDVAEDEEESTYDREPANPKQRKKHNYTSELELKSLLIRVKNDRKSIGDYTANDRINKYIKWHVAVVAKKYDKPNKRNVLKNKLKDKIIELSERTRINDDSYERFGTIILLMVKNILKKPQFSGYTYKDDFYSDASYKILKYLHNFDHTMISERTGASVNAFAYISQIIHNSILFIINSKKKDLENLRKQIAMETLDHDNQPMLAAMTVWEDRGRELEDINENIKIETIELTKIETTLVDEIKKLEDDINRVDRIDIYYPKTYLITMDEYSELSPLLKGKVNIIRTR